MKLNQWQRLGLPVALGICAAFLNWVAVTSKLEPREYVAVRNDIPPGKKIELEDLQKVVICHDSVSSLDQALIPWAMVHALKGNYMQRAVAGDCLLTQFDLLDANVLPRANEEEVVVMKLAESERAGLHVFVGDKVDMRLQGRKIVSGARVLSIARNDKELTVRVGVPFDQLERYARVLNDEFPKLKLTEHKEEIAKSN